ncbi:hypothetical protein [Actinoplanes sp. NPDC026670]|uniref:hypothetical protein n=1 Tax=Actinoplanes sp. NPDC026670 TaxID=3154700 RepID=UPI0034100D73
MSSRRIGLTASFLALAAGGLAACDSPEPEVTEWETPVYSSGDHTEPIDTYDEEEDTDEVFYCADEEGMVVEEEFCADTYPSGTYFLWHSRSYAPDLTPGDYLDDGDYFDANDKATRKAFKLPATGLITNGTIKTGVVGTTAGSSSSGS